MLDVRQGVSIYEIDGPFFFGIATKFDEMMRSALVNKPIVRIIRMRKVAFVDATGLHNLEILINSSQKEGIHIVLSGVKPNVRESLHSAGIDKLIGDDHICDHITKAVRMANRIADNELTEVRPAEKQKEKYRATASETTKINVIYERLKYLGLDNGHQVIIL